MRNVVLSEEGEAFVQRSISARQSWLKDIPARLTEEQQDKISESLKVLVDVFQ